MYVFVGFFVGFLAAIPLGPVNVFVISQTMKRDFFHGLMAGLTAAVLDFVYCLVAVLGLSQVTAIMNKWVVVLKAAAAIFLVLIGTRLFKQSKQYVEAPPTKQATSFSPRPMIAVLVLYISNPSLYLFWIWAAAWVTSHGWLDDSHVASVIFSLACAAGGALWYLILTRYVSKYHRQFSPKTFRTIFLVLAIFLVVSAAYTFLSIFINFKALFKALL